MQTPIDTLRPPNPPDRHESARWEHTRQRRRLLDGTWKQDLEERRREHMGVTRSEGQGPVDLSSNPYRVINRELAVLYHSPPEVRHDAGDLDDLLGAKGKIAQSGLWSSMARFQTWVLGCREYLMRIHVDETGALRYRPVPPDYVVAKASEAAPDTPVELRELRLRRNGKDWIWTWDVYDIRRPDNPVYAVFEAKTDGAMGADLTGQYLRESKSGGNYPYRYADGTPFLPFVLYHAERLGDRLWDAYEGRELVEGSLNLAVGYSFLYHCIRDASWPQRVIVDATAATGVDDAEDGTLPRSELVSDPAVIMVLRRLFEDQSTQPLLHQWEAAADPESLERTLAAMGARLAQDAGISPSDVQRMGGTARSGYAISLSNNGKRQAQRRYEAQFRYADEALVAKTAALLNRFTGSDYPEGHYAVRYKAVPMSPEEREAIEESVFRRLEAGLISRVEAYRELNEGLTPEQAVQALSQIEGGEKLLIGQMTTVAEIVGKAARREIPRDAAVAMVAKFLEVDTAEASTLVGSAGATFSPPEPAAA